MTRAPRIRPQRAPIFIGGEGQSEISYAAWIRNLVRDLELPFHLELCDLGRGAGDPLARINLAIDRLIRLETNREPFIGRFVFLDTDQLATDPDRAAQARHRAREYQFDVIWQDPMHEAFLLRHFRGCETRRPSDKRAAERALARVWPDYHKPSTDRQLERRIDVHGARRVAAGLPELAALLRMIRLLDD